MSYLRKHLPRIVMLVLIAAWAVAVVVMWTRVSTPPCRTGDMAPDGSIYFVCR